MRIAPLALALVVALGVPAAAKAASRNTARASGTIPLRAGPGSSYYTVGQLPNGARVHLESCTCGSNWCLVLVDGVAAGWARGSYLVGSAAKAEVTPPELLFNPRQHHHRRGYGFFDDYNDDDDDFLDTVACNHRR